MDLGGYHVRFNCVSSETLMEAQVHPENYGDLIVGVGSLALFYTPSHYGSR